MKLRLKQALLAATLAASAGTATAAYPEKPITIIVPFAAGGSTDILARTLGDRWTRMMGQPVVVDNRAGASGNIGANIVAKAKPDGYTLLVDTMSTHAMNPALMPNMPFKGVEDFTPIAQLANVINTMVVSSTVPVSNVKEFIAYAKAHPGQLNYASAGPGSTNHLSAAMFEKAAGIKMQHVPYKGGAPAVTATAAGETQVFFTASTQSLPFVKTGKLKLLAVTEAKRTSLLPDVPTVGESLPGYAIGVWYGLFGPANMPKELVDKLNAAANSAMADPDVQARMASMGVELTKTTPAEFSHILKADAKRYGKIIRELGITGE